MGSSVAAEPGRCAAEMSDLQSQKGSKKKLCLTEFLRLDGEDDAEDRESVSSYVGPISSDTEDEDEVKRGVGRTPKERKMDRRKEQEDSDTPPGKDEEEARDINRADAEFLTHLLSAQNSGLGLEAAQGMLNAFQKMKGIALKRAIRVANLEGQLQGQGHRQEEPAPTKRTYLETLTQKDNTGTGGPTGSTSNRERQTPPPKVLLVETRDPQAIHPTKVQEYVSSTFDPREMGLKRVTIRTTSKGVAVITNDEVALEKLASAIAATPATRALNVRQGSERRPVYKLVGVDPAVEVDTVGERLLEQNDIEGNKEDCKVLKDMATEGGSRRIIVEVSRQISKQLFKKNKVQIGWTVCALYKSPNIPRCSKCARYGHLTRDCFQKAPTCMHCSAPHDTRQCNGSAYDCPACGDHSLRPRDHSMLSYRCPVYCQQVERATRTWG